MKVKVSGLPLDESYISSTNSPRINHRYPQYVFTYCVEDCEQISGGYVRYLTKTQDRGPFFLSEVLDESNT